MDKCLRLFVLIMLFAMFNVSIGKFHYQDIRDQLENSLEESSENETPDETENKEVNCEGDEYFHLFSNFNVQGCIDNKIEQLAQSLSQYNKLVKIEEETPPPRII